MPSSTSGTCSATGCACDRTTAPARLGRHPRLQRGRARSSPCLDRLFEAVDAAVRGRWWSCDSPTTRRVPVARAATRGATSRGCATLVNTYGRGPAHAIRYGIDQRAGAGRRGHDGRRLRRPAADRRPGPPGRARRRRGRRLALHAGRPAGRRPAAQGRCCRGPPAGRSHWFARVGTRDATNSFKAYDREFVQRGRHRQPRRLRDRARADGQGTPAAPAGRRDPHDLARPRPSASPTSSSRMDPAATCAGTASPSGRELDRSARELAARSRPTDSRRSRHVSKVLVTGSAGFIGGYVVEELLAPRLRGRRHRQLLEVRPGRASPTTTTRTTASSRATPATST